MNTKLVTNERVVFIHHLCPENGTTKPVQALVIPEKFQHILRIMNTNIDGKTKVMFAMTAIKGMGRRYSNIVLKKADIDLTKRAGELSEEEVSYVSPQLNFASGRMASQQLRSLTTQLIRSFYIRLLTLLGISPQVEKVITIMSNPRQYKIPDWFLNRQKDIKDGKFSQVRNASSLLHL